MKYNKAKLIYKGKRISLLSVAEEISGKSHEKEVVDHPGAVVILPLIDSEHLILIRNERLAVQTCLWELPAGTVEPNEDPAVCASRELEEETGFCASFMEPLLQFYTTPGFCNEKLEVFLAKDLHFKGQHLDASEKIEVHQLPLKQAVKMIKEGLIQDAKTIATLLYFHQFNQL